MRALSPTSQHIVISCLQDGLSDQATLEGVNSLRGADQYSNDEIQNFRKTSTLFLSQQITSLESERHSIANATGKVDAHIRSLQNDLYKALMHKISELQGQRAGLANMDGSIDRQISNLDCQLQALLAQIPQPGLLPSTRLGSESEQSTQTFQHVNPPVQTSSTSRMAPQPFPTSLRSSQDLGIGHGLPGRLSIAPQVTPMSIPRTLIRVGRRPNKRHATDDVIRNYLRRADGSPRTQAEVLTALHDAGFGASNVRIIKQMRLHNPPKSEHEKASERMRPTDNQIVDRAFNADGTLRTKSEISSALYIDGFTAASDRVSEQIHLLRNAGCDRGYNQSATEDQILEYSRNADGSLRTNAQIGAALRADGLSVSHNRVSMAVRHLRPSRLIQTIPLDHLIIRPPVDE